MCNNKWDSGINVFQCFIYGVQTYAKIANKIEMLKIMFDDVQKQYCDLYVLNSWYELS